MTTITINESELQELGENVQVVRKDNLLILVIDSRRNLGKSTSGKTNMIATTHGFVQLPGGVSMNINIGKRA